MNDLLVEAFEASRKGLVVGRRSLLSSCIAIGIADIVAFIAGVFASGDMAFCLPTTVLLIWLIKTSWKTLSGQQLRDFDEHLSCMREDIRTIQGNGS